MKWRNYRLNRFPLLTFHRKCENIRPKTRNQKANKQCMRKSAQFRFILKQYYLHFGVMLFKNEWYLGKVIKRAWLNITFFFSETVQKLMLLFVKEYSKLYISQLLDDLRIGKGTYSERGNHKKTERRWTERTVPSTVTQSVNKALRRNFHCARNSLREISGELEQWTGTQSHSNGWMIIGAGQSGRSFFYYGFLIKPAHSNGGDGGDSTTFQIPTSGYHSTRLILWKRSDMLVVSQIFPESKMEDWLQRNFFEENFMNSVVVIFNHSGVY